MNRLTTNLSAAALDRLPGRLAWRRVPDLLDQAAASRRGLGSATADPTDCQSASQLPADEGSAQQSPGARACRLAGHPLEGRGPGLSLLPPWRSVPSSSSPPFWHSRFSRAVQPLGVDACTARLPQDGVSGAGHRRARRSSQIADRPAKGGLSRASELRDRQRRYIDMLVSVSHDVDNARAGSFSRTGRSEPGLMSLPELSSRPDTRLRDIAHDLTNWEQAGVTLLKRP